MSTTQEVLAHVGGSIADLLAAYRSGKVTPHQIIDAIIATTSADTDNPIWITPPDRTTLQPYLDGLAHNDPSDAPLWGVPFAVKDNIDVRGMPTTAACPAYRYQPEASAFVIQRLVDAGAIPVGKTNMDQFATGLVGVRSPYGIPVNPQTPELAPGGSSSGSAIALACDLVSFSLGTDTAGSGRIPAGFNRLTGFKPTRGLLSTRGVVPACRSLDCVSIFTRSAEDAARVAAAAAVHDPQDSFARPNPAHNALSDFGRWSNELALGVIEPNQLAFFGDAAYTNAYAETLTQLQKQGVALKPIDFRPFVRAAEQLYEGPWVTERYIAMEEILDRSPDKIWPVTRQIVSGGRDRSASEVYRSIYALAELRSLCAAALASCDALLTPTAGKHFSLAELEDDPVGHNQSLGHYTNYMNLLDFCGLAIPGLDTAAGRPFGITLVADTFQDTRLLAIGTQLERMLHGEAQATDHGEHRANALQTFKDPAYVNLAVCGAHMAKLPLNFQLTSRGGVFIEATRTSATYRLFALAGDPPMRPGLVRQDTDSMGASAIELEIWRLPVSTFASFVEGIPSPLGIGSVETESGAQVLGFLCEQAGLSGATDITEFGGWRAFLTASNH